MPGSPSQGIFLSYRREDAAPYARLLQFQLRERFPDAQVFMDLDSIEAGLPFAQVIRDAVDSCTVLVALIGRQWATLTNEEGQRRLDNPDDLVRCEIQAALERGVRVIPVLVDGARALRSQQLPSGLQQLAGLNALELSYSRIEYDAARLLDLIRRVLAAAGDQAVAGHKTPQDAEQQTGEEAGRQAREGQARRAPKLTASARDSDGTLLDAPRVPSLAVEVGDQRHTFNADFTAGRQGDLVIEDDFASPHHARFQTAHGMWFIEDLDSANGTWLNGRRVHAPQHLKRRDKIKMGHTVLTVVSGV